MSPHTITPSRTPTSPATASPDWCLHDKAWPNIGGQAGAPGRTGITPPRLDLRANWAFFLVVTLLAAIGAVYIGEAITGWTLLDMSAYRDAALRIRAGEILYGGDVHQNSAYRYAPWFAHAWVPLTYLPDAVVRVGWSVLLLVGAAISVVPLLRGTKASALSLVLFAPLMFGAASGGNVQPLMIGALVWGLTTRWGWLAVGFAASLKLIPLAFCAVFIAERRWWQVAGAVTLTAVLWAPVIWMPVEPITFDTGLARLLPTPFWAVVPLFGATVALGFAARRSRHTSLAAAVAAILALPRLFVYEIAILLPATRPMSGMQPEARAKKPSDP